MHILVVDDQPLICNIHSELLIEGRHTVETAENGQRALELFQQALNSDKPFDLVMTDQEMPVMTGLELASQLHKDYPGFPVMMVSSVENVELMISLMKLGISFFRKPLKKDELYAYLKTVQSQIKLQRELETQRVEFEHVQSLMEAESFTLILDNDPDVIPQVIKYILGRCEKHLISEQITFRVHFGMEETLINAIAHGNLEMGSAEFKKDGQFLLWQQEIQRRRHISPYNERQIKVHVHIQRAQDVKISVQDEGTGFDHESVLSKITSDDIYQAYGRGLIMLKGMADRLEYNRKGNCVYMTFLPQEE
ncbi:MAG: response regulator [SAR324 cluster bacterium]|nr:response regulator [SAR324 cluster bacterium]